MNFIKENWTEIKEIVKREYNLSSISYDTWIEPLQIHKVENNIDTFFISIKEHNDTNSYVFRYEENKELIKVIFDTPLLEEFINNNYSILDIKILSNLLSKYRGIEKYLELVSSVPKEIDIKLNKLALNFINYYNEALDLSCQEPNPYQKVLQ